MTIDESIRKCVAFVGYRMANGEHKFAGSGFFIGANDGNGRSTKTRFVTARHVIDGIRDKGLDEVYLRFNTREGGSAWEPTKLTHWLPHIDKSVDVSIIQLGTDNYDHLVLPLEMGATDATMTELQISLGDEVFITGMFHHYLKGRRNTPIVRVGNIASLREQRIQASAFGEMDAFLIEARSLGGLSGSPVFANLGYSRRVGKKTLSWEHPRVLLLGLIHGHFDVRADAIDGAAKVDQLSAERVNTGIAVVVPFQKVLEVLHGLEIIIKHREKQQRGSQSGESKPQT
jgi:hypothetical protein